MTLLDLIRHPHVYFEALKRLPPAPWRMAWIPVLAGLIGGVGSVLLSRSILDTQLLSTSAALGIQLPGSVVYVLTVIFSAVASFVTWLILWGMGGLGAGRDARSGEVYAASFLAPLLWALALLALALLTPPQVNVAAPRLGGLTGAALKAAISTYTSAVLTQYGASPLVRFSNVMTYAIYVVQFWLAYIGLRGMTDDRARAWKGVLYPGLLFLALGAAALLIADAAASVGGLI
ncbi:hypothetical protein Q0M94_02025 [Deinococcus radiomollis]|uniref:hypothetical protein n=1 Tax=Deinococcus radiomollis TaxID=468916 RepID=UPI0038916BBE